MLTINDVRLKAEEIGRLALGAGQAYTTASRDVATPWRLLEVEAVFMDAMRTPGANSSLLSTALDRPIPGAGASALSCEEK